MGCFLGSTVDYKKEKRWQRPTALGLGSPGTRKGTGVASRAEDAASEKPEGCGGLLESKGYV